jgi:hypothetical protein
MKIALTRGLFTFIDDEDFDKVSKFSWCATANGYAVSRIKNKIVYLHRFLLTAPKNTIIDHINGDKLDNRKKNLRFCNTSENVRNQKKDRQKDAISL